MKVFLSLSSILIKAFYGINRIGKIKSPRQVLKGIGMGLLILYGLGSIAVMFVAINMANYEAYSRINLQELIILNNLIMIVISTFIFSIIMAMSVYFLSNAEISFQAFPLKPWQIFGSKLLVVYISEAVISLLIMLPMIIIFAVKEQPGLPFYVYGILVALLLPVVPICFTFAVLVPVMRLFRFMRRKNIMLTVAGIIGIAFMIVFQVYYQRNMLLINNPEYFAQIMNDPNPWLTQVASVYPPVMMFWKSLSGYAGAEGLAYMIAGTGLSAAAVGLAVLLLSRAYTSSLIGFNEQSLRKLADSDAYISKSFRSRPVMLNLIRREWNLMNREPVYFFNGPFIIFLFPLILVIMFFAQRSVLEEQLGVANIINFIENLVDSPMAVLAAAGVGGFLGTSTLVASTSWSRDAKFLPQIKSLPINPGSYGLAKLLHSLLIGVAGIIVGTLPVIIILRLSLLKIILSLGMAVGYVWLLNIGGLYLDTAVPKLKWDSPVAASKQNLNGIAAVLGTMGVLALIGAAIYFLKINIYGYFFLITLPLLTAAGFLTWKYPAFAVKRMMKIEV